MGIQNSHAQDTLLNLVTETIADGYAFLADLAPSSIKVNDFERDIAYLNKRVSEEGLTFLTVTLPRLGDWLDQYVWGSELERVEGFKPYDGLFPCFLRPFWIYIQTSEFKKMTSDSARLYRILRTALLGLKKLNVPTGPDKENEKLSEFLRIEDTMETFTVPATMFTWKAQFLTEQLFQHYRVEIELPRHGPGAVAGGERHNEKWTWSTLYASVHAHFPYWDYMYPVRSATEGRLALEGRMGGRRSRPIQLAANASRYRALAREASPTARLLTVPKDSRGPRVISCEPKELMYLQQGAAAHLVSFLEKHPWTKGHVNFDDQSINANLALEASASKAWDTIDLSDASDRVSVELIKFLFPRGISEKWLALRSTATQFPDGTVVGLQKFAPMGSALCFPVESVVFWLLAVASVWEQTGNLRLAMSSVYVYGDDIIVASGYTTLVMESLESCFLKVNKTKSFLGAHPFRESCGIEAINGHDVTPLRVKKLPPRRPGDGTAIVAWTKYAENTQYIMPRRSSYQLKVVESLVGAIPRVPFEQPFLCLVTQDGHWTVEQYNDPVWCADLCYYRVRALTIQNRKETSDIDGWHRLQRNLILNCAEGNPTSVVDRSSTQIRRKRVSVLYLGI